MKIFSPGVAPSARPLLIARGLRAFADGFVAVRESSHPTAQALVLAFGGPVTTTSANPAGEPPATAPEQVEEMFEGRCRVIHGGVTLGGAPTTLARVRGSRIEILRQGALRIEVE